MPIILFKQMYPFFSLLNRANKSANTSLDSSSISTSGPSPPVQSSSRPSPSPVPSPSPSRASSPSSISSGRSGNYFASSLSTAGTGSSGSGGVSEYLNRRTMSGENSYGELFLFYFVQFTGEILEFSRRLRYLNFFEF